MKPAKFAYERPDDLAAAVSLLAKSNGEGKALAGGQSLVPMMNLRLAQPGLLVDLGALRELRGAEARDGQTAIGAATTHAAIEDGKLPAGAHPMLRHVAANIAYRGVRNRGTIGGSLAHADPSADWPAALLALGAEIDATSPKGARKIAMADFVVGAFTTALEPDEVLCRILVPAPSREARWSYQKINRKTGEFAHAIAAVSLDAPRGFARVVVGATGGAPILLPELARRLAAKDGASFAASFGKDAALGMLAMLDNDPLDREVHAAMLARAVRAAFA